MTLRACAGLSLLAGALAGALLPPLAGCLRPCDCLRPDPFPAWDLPVGTYAIATIDEGLSAALGLPLEAREGSAVEITGSQLTIRIGVEGGEPIEGAYEITERTE